MTYFLHFNETQNKAKIPTRLETLYFKAIQSVTKLDRETAEAMLRKTTIQSTHYSFSSDAVVN